MLKQLLFNKILMGIFKTFFKINLKSKQVDLSTQRCLILAPHPDDESIGMGGVLAKYPYTFDVACLTNGNKGVREVDTTVATTVREAEFNTAMEMIHAQNVFWLGIEDQHLLDGFERFKTLDLSEYDVIFVPNLLDQHPDHKAVSYLVQQYFKQYPYKAKKGLQIAFYEVWAPLSLPNTYSDITDVIDVKRAMINAHISQVTKMDFANMAVALNQYRGFQRGVAYAEAFCMVSLLVFNEIVNAIAFLE
jgi:LmbE family N-acetylglucosaminyl deacetylase